MRYLSTFFAVLMLACMLPSSRSVAAETALIPLNIGTQPADIGAEVYYAKELKFFEKNGLDVKIFPFQNGATMASAVVGGAIDVGWSNTIALANAHLRGINFTILAPANMHVATAPTAGILAVLRTSPIRSAKDVAGKTFAAGGINQIADTAAKAWVDANGGDSTKVRFVEMPLQTMVAALETGHIDVAIIDTNNYPTEGKPGDPLRRLGSAFDAISPAFAASVWFASSDWAAKHPEAVKAFAATMRQTAAWANTHHRESAAILAKYTKQSEEQIMGTRRVTYGERLTDESVQPEIDVAAKYGIIKSPVPAADLINSNAR